MTGPAVPRPTPRLAVRAGLTLMLALAAHAAGAQQAGPAPAPNTANTGNTAPAPTQALGAVKVSGQRNAGLDPTLVTAERSKLLSRRYASSCGFMKSYSAAEDEVTLAYLRDFRVENTSEADRFSDLSPDGNAATAAVGSALAGTQSDTEEAPDAMASAVGCSGNDRRLAAGRNWIARKDKSLEQAFDAVDAGDYTTALARFEEGWKKLGYEESALMLGRLHLLGLGTPASTAKAVAWLREVTEARYDPQEDRLRYNPAKPDEINTRVDAALMLARIHLTGQGTPRNPAEAYKWWAKALEFGFEPAGTLLAQAHLSGIGAAADAKRALTYLQAAGEAGDLNALYMLGQLHHHQLPQQPAGLPLDLKRAGAYYGAAANRGHVDATYAAARMLDLGEGLPAPAPERAVVLYKEAAVKGHADAQNALATYFYRGEVVAQDLATARQLFEAAAKGRQADAMLNLAVMQAKGEGGAQDLVQAYAWCSLSTRLGNDNANAPLAAIAARLTPEQRAQADALLKPAGKS